MDNKSIKHVSLSYVDINILLANLDDDMELVQDVCLLFLNNYEKDIAELSQAVRARKPASAFSRAHAFKFILGLLGAHQGLRDISFLETHIQSGSWPEVDNRLSELCSSMKIIHDQIRDYISGEISLSSSHGKPCPVTKSV